VRRDRVAAAQRRPAQPIARGGVHEAPRGGRRVLRYAWRPTFRAGTILSGVFLALGIQLFLQQTGVMEFTPLRFWLALVLGGLAGMLWSWSAHVVAVQGANRRWGDGA
jgi:hypothetical protein